MDPNHTRQEIATLVTSLLERGIAISGQMPVLRGAGQASVITWPTFAVQHGAPHDELGAIGEYRSLLAGRQFTCVLSDGALLQLAYTFDRDRIATHRLCFYPCPVRLEGEDDELDQGLLELIDSLLEEEFAGPATEVRFRGRSPIRFDFNAAIARRDHSACHAHWESPECRWPVFGPLSVGHFVRFVFRRLYPEVWIQHRFVREWPLHFGRRTMAADEELELHVECRQPLLARVVDAIRR